MLDIAQSALAAVRGDRLVAQALARTPLEGSSDVLALGKAAGAMALGACQVLGERLDRALVITKPGHVPAELAHREGLEVLQGGHPLPTQDSLRAGARLLEWLRETAAERRLLVLLSGGASSLAEAPAAGLDLDDLARINRWLLASGLAIEQVNAVRRRVSRIKGGRLLEFVGSRPLVVWLISDVAGDDPAVIGSGPLYPETARVSAGIDYPAWLQAMLGALPPVTPHPSRVPEHRVLGNLQMARDAAARRARDRGLSVTVDPVELDGDAEQTGRELARRLMRAPPGVYVWGGETTVRLPHGPGRGGRNQHLALAAATELAGQQGVALLAIGTDGTDGPTEDAGALIDADTTRRGELSGLDAGEALRRADSGAFLEASGDLVSTGPTGTNVRDLVIACKG